jgi:hypothetical protein
MKVFTSYTRRERDAEKGKGEAVKSMIWLAVYVAAWAIMELSI